MSCGRTGCHCHRGHDAAHGNAARKAEETRRGQSECDGNKPMLSNHAVGQALGAGVALDPGVRNEMEARFGQSFADVRVHDDASAHGLAQWHLAQAFTVGNHVAFNTARYQPTTGQGKRLLAHELAHVVQQRRGGATPAAQGDSLEASADSAASSFASGSGPVQVAGASAVGVARQPLPAEEMNDLPAAPRSLYGSLAKDEKSLSDPQLDRELTLMEAWLVDSPKVPNRDFMVTEYRALYAERAARRARRTPAKPPRPQPKEGSIASLYSMVEGTPMQSQEVEEAHRAYLATGQIFQTSTPFSWIEIKRGKLMSRAQRYDAMLLKLGMRLAQIEDVVADNRDAEYVSKDEFHDEFFARVHAEQEECSSWLKGREGKCLRAIDDKYGGPAFKADRADKEMRLRQQIMEVSDKIAAVRDSGAISLAGRVLGYGAGAATGHDAMRWSEYGAAIFSLGDVALPTYVGYSQRSQQRSYDASGGLVVGRDAPIGLLYTPEAQSTPAPDQVTDPMPQRPSVKTTRLGANAFPWSPARNDNTRTSIAKSDVQVQVPQKPAENMNVQELVAQGMARLGPQRSLGSAYFDEAAARFDDPAPLQSGFGTRAKQKQAQGVHGTGEREVGVHIDEPLPVGDKNVSEARRVQRALDPHNREILDLATNPQTKHLGINDEIIDRNRHPVLPPVSLKNASVSPSVVLTRRFDEVAEMREVFDEAVAKIRDQTKYTAGELKEKINGNFWEIVGGGKSPAGITVRDAFRKLGFEYIAGKGMRAVKSKAGGVKPPPTMEIE